MGSVLQLLKRCQYGLTLLLVLASSTACADWFNYREAIMGTAVHVELWLENKAKAQQCADQVMNEMRRIDALMSPFKPSSEVSKVNREAANHWVSISPELYDLINTSLAFSKLTHGAFDITFASVGSLYDYRNLQQPDAATVNALLPNINYKHIQLSNGSIRFTQKGVKIDLGGIAKGYAVDHSIRLLKQCGIEQALVSAGGDSRILGDKRGRPWMIGVQHPRDDNAIALRIPLENVAVSTSGDYERYFLSQGQRVHHIINPKTGTSSKQSWSATVIAHDATTSDALSTSVFVLGAQKGLDLINQLVDVDAIIIDSKGRIHYSSELVEPTQQ